MLEKKASGDEKGTYSYEYNDDGTVAAENFTSYNGSYDNYTMTYNDEGYVATKSESSSSARDGNVWEYTYEYDDQGRAVEVVEVNITADNRTTKYTYEYDENGYVISETETHYDGGINGTISSFYEMENTYDENGNMVVQTVYSDGDSYKHTYKYDVVGAVSYSTENSDVLVTTDKWISFDEWVNMPTPTSCINSISDEGKEANSDAVIYTYTLGNNKADANKFYKMYQSILLNMCELELEVDSDGIVYIYDEGELVSVMMAGTDEEIGYFLSVSFNAK